MTKSTPPPLSAGSGVDASTLSRRELQYLARELELCRGNAKSEVIVEHLEALLASSDGAARIATVFDAMPEEFKTRTPRAKAATPARGASRATPREEVTPHALSFAEDATTPTRRSSRTSSQTGTSDKDSDTASAPPSRSSTPPLGHKMDSMDSEESPVEQETPAKKDTSKKESTPTTKDVTPAKKEVTREKKEVMSEKKEATPAKKEATPAKKEVTPAKKEVTPINKEATPVKKEATPAKKEATPAKKEVAPSKKEVTPTKKEATPVKKEETPAKKEKTPTKTTTTTIGVSSEEAKVSTKTPPRRTTPVKTGRSPLANVSNVATKRSSKSAPATVEELLESVDDLIAVSSDRVKCTTTGHEMKADFDVISAYISGKRYQRAHSQKVSFAKFAPMFVDHPDEKQSHLVWCSVTQSAITRNVERIEAHMNAARYQKELPVWQAEQAALAAAKEAAQKEQDAQKGARAKAPHRTPMKKNAKRKASGAIPAEERKVKVPRSEAK